MKTYPVYFRGREIYQWNPLKESLMEAIRFQLEIHDISTTNYENLLVDFDKDKVFVMTRMAGEGG